MTDAPAPPASQLVAQSRQQGGLSDPLYLALLDHHDTPEADIAFQVVIFHRDIGNGGLSQAVTNARFRSGLHLAAFAALGLEAHARLIAQAIGLGLGGEFDELEDNDPIARFMAVRHGREDMWDSLDKAYFSLGPDPGKRDPVELRILDLMEEHPAAFAGTMAAAARLSTRPPAA
jgi:hypothetical protein